MNPVDSTRVREWALGTIAEWLPGYTDTLEDGHQRKITDISDVDQGPLTISVDRTSPNDGNPEVFVVDVTVIKAHAYHEWPAVGACSDCGQVESAAVHQ